MPLSPDERMLRKLDELLGGVEDINERLHLISKAIEHLQRMQTQIQLTK